MAKNKNRQGTETSSFGVSGRINHDSSKFYNSKLYENRKPQRMEYRENKIEEKHLNKIFCKSSEDMSELPDNSVHLMVTSPPYNVGKEYDEDLSLQEYLELLERVFKEVYRALVPGGRACVNIANLGRKPYLPLHSYIINIMEKIGFLMRGEVIWNKEGNGASSTAWGTWLSAKNPVLRDQHEYILIFSKGRFSRDNPENRESTIEKDEFLNFTRSVWAFPPESAQKIGHPAPFPVELPTRCIRLYTFQGEVILDPFMGSGTTALAANKTDRRFVGYEIKGDYIEIANKRLEKELNQSKIKQFAEEGKGDGEPATRKQKKYMKDLGIDFPENTTKKEASRLIEEKLNKK